MDDRDTFVLFAKRSLSEASVTHDIDLFTEINPDDAVRVAASLRQMLTEAGLQITPAARPPHANRFVATTPAPGGHVKRSWIVTQRISFSGRRSCG